MKGENEEEEEEEEEELLRLKCMQYIHGGIGSVRWLLHFASTEENLLYFESLWDRVVGYKCGCWEEMVDRMRVRRTGTHIL